MRLGLGQSLFALTLAAQAGVPLGLMKFAALAAAGKARVIQRQLR